MSAPVYLGPCSLPEALALAEEQNGVRLALSVPYGAWIAVQVGEVVRLRRVARQSGQGGSEAGSGEWSEAGPGAVVQWRPG